MHGADFIMQTSANIHVIWLASLGLSQVPQLCLAVAGTSTYALPSSTVLLPQENP